jgi:hypothetical protein
VSSENGPCCGTITYFVGGEGGEELVYINTSQTLSIWDNYSVVFVYPEIHFEMCFGITLAMCHETYHAGSYPKNHGLPEDANFRRPCNFIHSPPCRTSCRVFIHEIFFEPLDLHLRV